MFKETGKIKKAFEQELAAKFGDTRLIDDVDHLCRRIVGKDHFVDAHLYASLQNILVLGEAEARHFLRIALDLAEASAFAPILFLEKVPTLLFYGLRDEVGTFLECIIHYGARAATMYLGSDHLRTEDLIDVLEQATIPYYREFIRAVTARHAEFGANCAILMRFAAKIESVVPREEIGVYLDLVSSLTRKYGHDIVEQLIRHTHELLPLLPLESVQRKIDELGKNSRVSVEFVLTHPKAYFSKVRCAPPWDEKKPESELSRTEKIRVLSTEDYDLALRNRFLDHDPAFAGLLLWWPVTNSSFRRNVLAQLSADDYKGQIIAHAPAQREIERINGVTRSNWMRSWLFCRDTVDVEYCRRSIKRLLQTSDPLSVPARTVFNQNKELFDRENPIYTAERVIGIAEVLLKFVNDDSARDLLEGIARFLSGDRTKLRDYLSREHPVIDTGDRDAWKDYGRADELFSCTGIGQYAADNTPGFLADPNLVNLDVWSCGKRVGRIHLCMVKDKFRSPVLLVDCVDGSERIIESEKKINYLLDAIREFAGWIGIEEIKINCEVDFNTTPKRFIDYVEKRLTESNRIDFMSRYCSLSSEHLVMPHPSQTFLEAFQKYQAAFVKGPRIKVCRAVSI